MADETRRSSGKPAEALAKRVLQAMVEVPCGEAATPLQVALAKGKVYMPFSDVPASQLREFGYHPKDGAERERMYNGPPNGINFCEYGADGIVERTDETGAKIVVQVKDYRDLSHANLTTFFMLTMQVRAHNMALGLPSDTPSGLLLYPDDCHVTPRFLKYLDALECVGIYRMALQGINLPRDTPSPTPSSASESGSTEEAEQEEEEEDLVPLTSHLVGVAPPEDEDEVAIDPLPDNATAEESEAYTKKIAESLRHKRKTLRPFQKPAVSTIAKAKGRHLVHAAPGTGKTKIIAHVVGHLIVKPRAVRASVRKSTTAALALPPVAFLTAPYIDHVHQLQRSLGEVMHTRYGTTWAEYVLTVRDKAVADSVERNAREIVEAVKAGKKRIVMSTDKSASAMLAAATELQKEGYPLLCVKDEAHYNSRLDAASTQLLCLAEPASKDEGAKKHKHTAIFATATPDANIYGANPYETVSMTIPDCTRENLICDFTVQMPLTIDVPAADETMPPHMRALAETNHLQRAALFVAYGFHMDGRRRCITYADDGKEAIKIKGYLEAACAAYGMACDAKVITSETSVADRKDAYKVFCKDPAYEAATFRGRKGTRPKVYVLIGVQILDACIDLVETDAVAFLKTPHTSYAYVDEYKRWVQRLGRGVRLKHNIDLTLYHYASPEATWLAGFLDAVRNVGKFKPLKAPKTTAVEAGGSTDPVVEEGAGEGAEEDTRSPKDKTAELTPDLKARVRFRNPNPLTAPLSTEDECAQREALFETMRKAYERELDGRLAIASEASWLARVAALHAAYPTAKPEKARLKLDRISYTVGGKTRSILAYAFLDNLRCVWTTLSDQVKQAVLAISWFEAPKERVVTTDSIQVAGAKRFRELMRAKDGKWPERKDRTWHENWVKYGKKDYDNVLKVFRGDDLSVEERASNAWEKLPRITFQLVERSKTGFVYDYSIYGRPKDDPDATPERFKSSGEAATILGARFPDKKFKQSNISDAAKSDGAIVRYGWIFWRTETNFDKLLADFDRSMAKRKREE